MVSSMLAISLFAFFFLSIAKKRLIEIKEHISILKKKGNSKLYNSTLCRTYIEF